MARRAFPLSKVYGLLEPGPVVLVTTCHRGRANVMPRSWHTMMEFEPPQIGCVLSNRNHSFRALRTTRECVVAIPTVELTDAVVGCGNSTGGDIDKFATFGLTPLPAKDVAAPLIGECYANLECRVVDAALVNRYNFFVLEVSRAWIDRSRKDPRTLHHRGRGAFMIAGPTVQSRSKMR